MIATAKAMLEYGAKGDVEARLTCGFAADALHGGGVFETLKGVAKLVMADLTKAS